MPQFPMTDSRRPVLERIPDYAVAISDAGKNITVSIADKVVAETSRALLIQETRHKDVYYLPREDVDLSLFEPTDHSTYCPFKGHANYFSYGDLENLVWSYEDPYPEVSELKDYLSFYTDRVEINVKGD